MSPLTAPPRLRLRQGARRGWPLHCLHWHGSADSAPLCTHWPDTTGQWTQHVSTHYLALDASSSSLPTLTGHRHSCSTAHWQKCHLSWIDGTTVYYSHNSITNYWNKVINGKKDKIWFLIYNIIEHLDCVGEYTSPWLGCVKSTLENCGLNGV